MNSRGAVLLGEQKPRVLLAPASVSSAGAEAIDLAEHAGLHLDPWQQFAVDVILAEDEDARWAAFEAAVIVARQNGKGGIIEAVALFSLFLAGDGLVIYSAHEFKTAMRAFQRILALIESTQSLRKRVRKVFRTHGEEGVLLHSGEELRFFARTSGSGRGFTGDRIFFDEAFRLSAAMIAALVPTLTTIPNPQILYFSTPPLVYDEASEHLRSVRQRALDELDRPADDPADDRLAWLEWSIPQDDRPPEPGQAPTVIDPDDRALWGYSNPAKGIRIDEDFIVQEQRVMSASPLAFLVEVLCWWQPEPRAGDRVVSETDWDHGARSPAEAEMVDPVTLAIDVSPLRDTATITASARSTAPPCECIDCNAPDPDTGELPPPPDLIQGEVLDHRAGTGWIVDRVIQLVADHDVRAVIIDPAATAGALIVDLEAAGIEVTLVSSRELGQACGLFLNLVENHQYVHLDDPVLNDAIAGAETRPLGGAFAWARKTGADITALVAMTLSTWGARHAPETADAAATPSVGGDVDEDLVDHLLAEFEEEDARAFEDLHAD